MSKVKVVLFAADPLSTPQNGGAPRLQLDEEVREYRQAVCESGNPDALVFDNWFAARTKDLLKALNKTRPQVVHFSGHGGDKGLVLVSADGRGTRCVGADALGKLFHSFRDVRVVVLNACFSLPQAQAIAAVVGCAIGTPRAISDEAAITFGTSFYRAIAYGHSVQVAYDQACSALSIESFPPEQHPQLVVGPGVDAARLVLVPPRVQDADARESDGPNPTGSAAGPPTQLPPARLLGLSTNRLGRRGTVRTLAGLAVTGAVAGGIFIPPPAEFCRIDREPSGRTVADAVYTPVAASATGNGSSADAPDLAAAKVLRRAGNHAAALPLFKRAVETGNPEAMGFLGVAYLHGEGTAPRRDSALHWLREAASKKDAGAMTALGVAHWNGDFGRRSRHWALHWLRRAVDEKRDAEAMRRLAGIYRSENKYDDALHLYEKAVRSGSVDARVDAAGMYEAGQGIGRDLDEARCLYRTAAKRGSDRGMLAMGLLHEFRIGGRPDYAGARKWYLKAVDAGSEEAMNRIGLLYLRGHGVEKSPDEAIRWFGKARDAGSTNAVENLRRLGVN